MSLSVGRGGNRERGLVVSEALASCRKAFSMMGDGFVSVVFVSMPHLPHHGKEDRGKENRVEHDKDAHSTPRSDCFQHDTWLVQGQGF